MHKLKISYFERYKKIKLSQSDDTNIYYRFLTRHISASITAILVNTSITPNIVTSTMFLFGIIGGICFSFGESLFYALGGIFFILLNVADTIDGELARYKGLSSPFGDYLDRLAHYVTNSSMILGLGIGLYINHGNLLILYAMIVVLLFYLFDDLSRDLIGSCNLGNNKNRKFNKEKMSIIGQSKIKAFISYTASNSGFWHLIIPVSILNFLFDLDFYNNESLNLIETYILYFAIASVGKTILRLPLIISLKNL